MLKDVFTAVVGCMGSHLLNSVHSCLSVSVLLFLDGLLQSRYLRNMKAAIRARHSLLRLPHVTMPL